MAKVFLATVCARKAGTGVGFAEPDASDLRWAWLAFPKDENAPPYPPLLAERLNPRIWGISPEQLGFENPGHCSWTDLDEVDSGELALAVANLTLHTLRSEDGGDATALAALKRAWFASARVKGGGTTAAAAGSTLLPVVGLGHKLVATARLVDTWADDPDEPAPAFERDDDDVPTLPFVIAQAQWAALGGSIEAIADALQAELALSTRRYVLAGPSDLLEAREAGPRGESGRTLARFRLLPAATVEEGCALLVEGHDEGASRERAAGDRPEHAPTAVVPPPPRQAPPAATGPSGAPREASPEPEGKGRGLFWVVVLLALAATAALFLLRHEPDTARQVVHKLGLDKDAPPGAPAPAPVPEPEPEPVTPSPEPVAITPELVQVTLEPEPEPEPEPAEEPAAEPVPPVQATDEPAPVAVVVVVHEAPPPSPAPEPAPEVADEPQAPPGPPCLASLRDPEVEQRVRACLERCEQAGGVATCYDWTTSERRFARSADEERRFWSALSRQGLSVRRLEPGLAVVCRQSDGGTVGFVGCGRQKDGTCAFTDDPVNAGLCK